MKKSFLLLIVLNFSAKLLAQNVPAPTYQDRNVTELIEFENSLPKKTYDYHGSDLLVKWHIIFFDLIEQTDGYTPNVAARNLAYINLAAYESMLPAYPKNISLSGQLQDYNLPIEFQIDSSDFSPQIAANSAIFWLMDKFFLPAPYVWMEKAYALKDEINDYHKNGLSDFAFMKSKNYGISVAEHIYKYSMTDGGHMAFLRSYDLEYRLPSCDSCFEINRRADLENTGPLHPHWQNNRSFLAENNSDFGIKPKVEFSKYPKSDFYKMAYEVYETSKTVNSGNEKYQIANFWDDAAQYTYTAPGHSYSILTQHLRNNPVALIDAAKIYVSLGIAVNDAIICAWKGKMKYNLIRPIAYIKRYIDSQWEPTLLTPPFPEFPSGHSVQSAAMATVLSVMVGDSVGFTDLSKFWVGQPRHYDNFWQAANETSISRLYGGIHYRDALDQGQDMGKLVGANALKLQFER